MGLFSPSNYLLLYQNKIKKCIMSIDLLTKQDWAIFKVELLSEIKTMLAPSKQEEKQWLKSYEVRELLGISPGTLQNMRISGLLTYSKVGGLLFYSYADILKLMEGNKKPIIHLLTKRKP